VANLVSVTGELHQLGPDLVVLDQAIDTGTPADRMLFHVLAAIAEFEHDLIAERNPRRAGRRPGPAARPATPSASCSVATVPSDQRSLHH
jgi:DNA invertase Pin-like site-specific DNA recombinase